MTTGVVPQQRRQSMPDRTIFITGASSGIGEAISLHYAGGGVTLGLLALDSGNLLDGVAERCRLKGSTVFAYVADVTDRLAMERAATAFLDQVESIDLVIANAGVAVVNEDFATSDASTAARNMQVNYFGVIHTFEPFLERMKTAKSGHLVAISSISSLRATHNSGAYSASKAAVNLWTEGLRLKLRPYAVAVTTVCVGFVDTAMTRGNSFRMPGLIRADQAASLISAAVAKRKRLTTLPFVSGTLWKIFQLMPGPLYDSIIDRAKRRVQQRPVDGRRPDNVR